MSDDLESKTACIWVFCLGVLAVAAGVYFLRHEPMVDDFWALNSWQSYFSVRLGFAGFRILLEYFLLAFGLSAAISALVFRNRPPNLKAVVQAAFEAVSKI